MVRGWVYVITNRAMPGLVKIGYTLKDPFLRAQELNHTGVPHPYAVCYDALVYEPRALEQKLHRQLGDMREGKEWFRMSASDVARYIREAASENLLLERVSRDELGETFEKASSNEKLAESVNNCCEFKGCDFIGDHVLNGRRYCLWHFREVRNPKKAAAIRLLREEQDRAKGNMWKGSV